MDDPDITDITEPGPSDPGRAGKRSSLESTGLVGLDSAKRIKTEAPDAEMVDEDDDDERLYYGDDNAEEISSVYLELLKPHVSLERFGIPVTIDKFLSSIIAINPNIHSLRNYADILTIKSKLRTVTGKLTFESLDIYCLFFLPTVLHHLIKKLTQEFNSKKSALIDSPHSCYQDSYILMKEEFHTELDLKLVKFRYKHENPTHNIGDFIFVRPRVPKSDDDLQSVFKESYFLGTVLSSISRPVQPLIHAMERMILSSFPESKRADLVCEEFLVRVRHISSLFALTDFQLSTCKLASLLPYVLQAKAFYSLGADLCQQNFLNPTMTIRYSGLTIEENLDLSPEKMDTIQKALDLVGQDEDSSCFLAIDFADPSQYDDLLLHILKQISLNVKYYKKKDELTPILVICKNKGKLEHFYRLLQVDEHYAENGVVLDPSKEEVEQVEKNLIARFQSHKASLNELKNHTGIDRYTKCIDFLEKNRSIHDLQAHWILHMQRDRRELKRELIRKAKVVLTSPETLSKDQQYMVNFCSKTAATQRILCCVVVDAHLFTEPEIVTLTNFGIKKFILMGCSSISLPEDDLLSPKDLNRPLFHRLKLISERNRDKSPYSCFVKL